MSGVTRTLFILGYSKDPLEVVYEYVYPVRTRYLGAGGIFSLIICRPTFAVKGAKSRNGGHVVIAIWVKIRYRLELSIDTTLSALFELLPAQHFLSTRTNHKHLLLLSCIVLLGLLYDVVASSISCLLVFQLSTLHKFFTLIGYYIFLFATVVAGIVSHFHWIFFAKPVISDYHSSLEDYFKKLHWYRSKPDWYRTLYLSIKEKNSSAVSMNY